MVYLHFASFPSPSEPPVPQQVFNGFHSVDRNLFSRLVFQLRRDPAESAKVMALWLWLERMNGRQLGHHWIKRTLLPSYPGTLNAFADESVTVLNCIERDRAVVPEPVDLPMFQAMTGTASVTLRDFYYDRSNVISGVNEMFERVCVRAFADLTQRAEAEVSAVGIGGGRNAVPVTVVVRVPLGFKAMASPPLLPPPPPPPVYVMQPQYVHHVNNYLHYCSGTGHCFGKVNPNDDLLGVRGINFDDHQDHELSELLRGLELNNINNGTSGDDNDDDDDKEAEEEEKEIVPADERTIFLTFSKGYPISESEVRDFFTSKFGDRLIEAIYMQDVRSSDEQPLYARLIVRSLTYVDVVLGGHSRMKFSIDGKHVWARKYVRKNFLL